ncbi:MAG: hypothetical protein ABIX01_17190 [Chitinophagaceae bacterium]
MTKAIRKKLDFIPLIILFVSAALLCRAYFNDETAFVWKHIFGFCLLIATAAVVFINHKAGVIMLGLTLLTGLLGLLSFSPEITTITAGFGDVPLVKFQPIFVLWIALHFVLSGRYYVGILNSGYWKELKSDEPFDIK